MKQKNRKVLSKKDGSKTMDVSKPGKTDPDISARPVIVTNHSMIQDPTLKDDSKPNPKPEGGMVARGLRTVSPDSDMSQEQTKTTGDKDSSENPAQKSETEIKLAQEAAVVDAVADQATEDKKKQNKESDAEIARKKELEQLISNKKYFVPIGQVAKRRNRRILIVLLVFIILILGAYIALDAGIIKSSIHLPYDLIKN